VKIVLGVSDTVAIHYIKIIEKLLENLRLLCATIAYELTPMAVMAIRTDDFS
jgi:hypothetical protein